jgi:hypothetical protein
MKKAKYSFLSQYSETKNRVFSCFQRFAEKHLKQKNEAVLDKNHWTTFVYLAWGILVKKVL